MQTMKALLPENKKLKITTKEWILKGKENQREIKSESSNLQNKLRWTIKWTIMVATRSS